MTEFHCVQLCKGKEDSDRGGGRALPPPPVVPELHPDDVLEVQLLPSPAVVAEPAAVRHLDAQAVGVEGRRAGLAAQQAPPCNKGALSPPAAAPPPPPRKLVGMPGPWLESFSGYTASSAVIAASILQGMAFS